MAKDAVLFETRWCNCADRNHPTWSCGSEGCKCHNTPKVITPVWIVKCFVNGTLEEVVGTFPHEEAAYDFANKLNSMVNTSDKDVVWQTGIMTQPEEAKRHAEYEYQ